MSDFMQRQIVRGRWLKVETTQGTEFVSVYDSGLDWPNSDSLTEDAREDSITQLQDYTEGEPQEWENVQGYGARLSAPGYLDCTEWTVFDSEQDAEDYLEEMYGEDETEEN